MDYGIFLLDRSWFCIHIFIKTLLFVFKQVFVANHTSMIDFIILEQMTPFAVIMQKHGGWVGKSVANTLVDY